MQNDQLNLAGILPEKNCEIMLCRKRDLQIEFNEKWSKEFKYLWLQCIIPNVGDMWSYLQGQKRRKLIFGEFTASFAEC